jgi:hypothetical protein
MRCGRLGAWNHQTEQCRAAVDQAEAPYTSLWYIMDETHHMRPASSTTHRERPVPRRGLSRTEAAIYLGISPSKFDELRKDGRIGPAKCLDGRKLWGVEMLDEFFEALPSENHDLAEDWTASV